MSMVPLREVLKETEISIRNGSTKAELRKKVKQAHAGQTDANENCV